jgi:hypothetical protein
MNQSALDDLLWELARLEEDGPVDGDDVEATFSEFPDAVLEAYRAGALSQEEMRRLEGLLGRSAAGRERLAGIAGVPPPAMSDAARRRFLRTLARPVKVRAERQHPVPLSPSWLLAAAMALVVLGGAWFLLVPGGVEDLSPLPAIQTSIRGLAEVRGDLTATGSDFTRAEPDTAVTVGVVVDPPRAGLAAGLYVFQPEASAVVRLPLQPTWEDRRTAVFRAPARDFVGESPGTYKLFAVIGRADGLPPNRILRSGERPEATFAGQDLKVELLRLEIVHGVVPPTGRGDPDREAKGP